MKGASRNEEWIEVNKFTNLCLERAANAALVESAFSLRDKTSLNKLCDSLIDSEKHFH